MKNLHRIQIDIDIEAESHQEAVEKVMDWFFLQNVDALHCHDYLVLEENEEVCPTCTPELLKSGYTIYQQYNLNLITRVPKEQEHDRREKD